MLFYADKLRALAPYRVRDEVVSTLECIAVAYRDRPEVAHAVALDTHADLVGAAIALGEMCQAVADHLNPKADDALPETDRLAAAGVLVGRCICRSAQLVLGTRAPRPTPAPTPPEDSTPRDGERGLVGLLAAAAEAVAGVVPEGLPPGLQARVPEGYAFYTLYPEMYLASAARALQEDPGRQSYAVLGIRSIGTSLATLVAGSLAERGLGVQVETLRPRGHPFDRYVELGPAMHRRLEACARAGMGFLVVDEGPGLTCSSFLAVCSALAGLGVGEDRIAILSAWQGQPSIYAGDEARARWARLRVFHTGAEEAFDGWHSLVPFVRRCLWGGAATEDGRTAAPIIHDLSYGRWRERCYPSPDCWPVVHRATERTKLLYHFPASPSESGSRAQAGSAGVPPARPSRRTSGQDARAPSECLAGFGVSPNSISSFPLPLEEKGGEGEMTILAKFAGLGDHGREKLARAVALTEAGFAPPVVGLAYGFLLHPLLEARPLEVTDLAPELLARMVEYYAFLARRFPAPRAPSFDRLAEMILVNARESLDLDAGAFVDCWRPRQDTIDALPQVLVDGKPQPYEWLEVASESGRRYLKADSSDHFRDHTVVDEQSILWDLAGALEEWEMDEGNSRLLIDLWERATGDRQAAPLLEFYRAAYLAFRVAALHYAVHSTDEEDVRRSLQHEEWNCRRRLGSVLAAGAPHG